MTGQGLVPLVSNGMAPAKFLLTLVVLAALFAWRAFSAPVPFGFV